MGIGGGSAEAFADAAYGDVKADKRKYVFDTVVTKDRVYIMGKGKLLCGKYL